MKAKAMASKKKLTNSLNPAERGLTAAENAAYKVLRSMQGRGAVITSGSLAEAWGGKNRSYVYRILQSLISKSIVENYDSIFYRLAKPKK